jgi:hypothetical protein
MTYDEEKIIHLYHLAVDLMAKISVQPEASIERLEARFKMEAALHNDTDSVALRCLATACQAYRSAE